MKAIAADEAEHVSYPELLERCRAATGEYPDRVTGDLFSAFLAQLILANGLAPEDVNLSEGLFDSPDNRERALRLCGLSNTGHKGPVSAGTSRPATLTDPDSSGPGKAAQAACRGSVPDLAATNPGPAARRRERRRGSEETRPLDGHAIRRGSRTTASGGDTTLSGPAPPALVH